MFRTLMRLAGAVAEVARQAVEPLPLPGPLAPTPRPPASPRRRARPAAPEPDVQLSLDLSGRPRTAEELLGRLRDLGLEGITRCSLTRNRTVMVSYRGGHLRVHQGYLGAPLPVLQAVVTFVSGRTRANRRAAQRVILSYHVARVADGRADGRPRARERTRLEDEPLARRLAAWHGRLNELHFGGRLRPVPVRVSRRLKARLGHYTAASPIGDLAEIVIGYRHIRRHGWEEALHTLLHEMVHQWQDETGHAIDHGRTFRAKAREVGITPAARRTVTPRAARPDAESHAVGLRAARDD